MLYGEVVLTRSQELRETWNQFYSAENTTMTFERRNVRMKLVFFDIDGTLLLSKGAGGKSIVKVMHEAFGIKEEIAVTMAITQIAVTAIRTVPRYFANAPLFD